MSKMRLVLQSVEKASLLVDNVDKWVDIKRGFIVFVSFLKEGDPETVVKAATDVVKVKMFPKVEDDLSRTRADALANQPWEVMVIPQATLAGKIKGKQCQYHSQIDKSLGADLYTLFCDTIKKRINSRQRGCRGPVRHLRKPTGA
eukprot:TRINITY_DN14480_c0_g1_i1.p1 TRINITY_DN14480_c0_g1~~TRINITY_DN14480_c0_g1_i1.p1  ORF type:complete len:145 (+),score=15.60 TRINITY_DN14480_c0_g1_i1:68-502(+)